MIPSETAGPYPGDGTNTNSSGVVNVLTVSGIVRSDIRSSVGTALGHRGRCAADGDAEAGEHASSCASLAGYAIYLWHCTREGGYSLYSNGITDQNYLRGVQVTDSDGEVTFTTIFPGCYSGRWPHMHFEVYPSLASATSGNNDVKTSQLALPARGVQPGLRRGQRLQRQRIDLRRHQRSPATTCSATTARPRNWPA